MSVVTAHMVYFCACTRSEIFPKNARELGVGLGQFLSGVNGLNYLSKFDLLKNIWMICVTKNIWRITKTNKWLDPFGAIQYCVKVIQMIFDKIPCFLWLNWNHTLIFHWQQYSSTYSFNVYNFFNNIQLFSKIWCKFLNTGNIYSKLLSAWTSLEKFKWQHEYPSCKANITAVKFHSINSAYLLAVFSFNLLALSPKWTHGLVHLDNLL